MRSLQFINTCGVFVAGYLEPCVLLELRTSMRPRYNMSCAVFLAVMKHHSVRNGDSRVTSRFLPFCRTGVSWKGMGSPLLIFGKMVLLVLGHRQGTAVGPTGEFPWKKWDMGRPGQQ